MLRKITALFTLATLVVQNVALFPIDRAYAEVRTTEWDIGFDSGGNEISWAAANEGPGFYYYQPTWNYNGNFKVTIDTNRALGGTLPLRNNVQINQIQPLMLCTEAQLNAADGYGCSGGQTLTGASESNGVYTWETNVNITSGSYLVVGFEFNPDNDPALEGKTLSAYAVREAGGSTFTSDGEQYLLDYNQAPPPPVCRGDVLVRLQTNSGQPLNGQISFNNQGIFEAVNGQREFQGFEANVPVTVDAESLSIDLNGISYGLSSSQTVSVTPPCNGDATAVFIYTARPQVCDDGTIEIRFLRRMDDGTTQAVEGQLVTLTKNLSDFESQETDAYGLAVFTVPASESGVDYGYRAPVSIDVSGVTYRIADTIPSNEDFLITCGGSANQTIIYEEVEDVCTQDSSVTVTLDILGTNNSSFRPVVNLTGPNTSRDNLVSENENFYVNGLGPGNYILTVSAGNEYSLVSPSQFAGQQMFQMPITLNCGDDETIPLLYQEIDPGEGSIVINVFNKTTRQTNQQVVSNIQVNGPESSTVTAPTTLGGQTPGSYSLSINNANPPIGFELCSTGDSNNILGPSTLTGSGSITFQVCIEEEEVPPADPELQVIKQVEDRNGDWVDTDKATVSFQPGDSIRYRVVVWNSGGQTVAATLGDDFTDSQNAVMDSVGFVETLNLQGTNDRSRPILILNDPYNPGNRITTDGYHVFDFETRVRSCEVFGGNGSAVPVGNTATVSATGLTTKSDFENVTVDFSQCPQSEPDLEIVKFVREPGGSWKTSLTGVDLGDQVEYAIYVYNRGDGDVAGADISVSDDFTSGMQWLESSNVPSLSVSGTLTGNTSCVRPTIVNGAIQNIGQSCVGQALPASGDLIFDIVDSVPTNPGNNRIENEAGVVDPKDGEEIATAFVEVNDPDPNFVYGKTCTVNGVPCDTPGIYAFPGDQVNYTLTVTNNGQGAGRPSGDISDNVFDLQRYADVNQSSIQVTQGFGSCGLNGSSISCSINSDLPAKDGQFAFSFNAIVRDSANNGWSVDDYSATNTFRGNTTTVRFRDLEITKRATSGTISPPDAVETPSACSANAETTWEFRVTNLSADSINNFWIKDTLPNPLEYIPGSLDGLNDINGPMQINRTVNGNGGFTTFTMQTCHTSPDIVSNVLTNQVEVSASQSGPTLDFDTADIGVAAQPISALKGFVWLDDSTSREFIETDERVIDQSITVELFNSASNTILDSHTINPNDSQTWLYELGDSSHQSLVVGATDIQIRLSQGSIPARYNVTGLNTDGQLHLSTGQGINEGSSCNGGLCTVLTGGIEVFQFSTARPIAATDDDNGVTFNFGLSPRTSDLTVNVWEVEAGGDVVAYDATTFGEVEVDANPGNGGDPRFGPTSLNNNPASVTYNGAAVGLEYIGDIRNLQSGWSEIGTSEYASFAQCNKQVDVTEDAANNVINLCIKGGGTLSIRKFVREAGTTNWSESIDLGTIDRATTVEYMVVAWYNGTGDRQIEVQDQFINGGQFLTDDSNPPNFSGTVRGSDFNPTNNLPNVCTGDVTSNSNFIRNCYTRTVRGESDQVLSGQNILNQASIVGTTTRTTAEVTVSYGAILTRDKIVNRAEARPGETVTYTLTVTNEGSAASQGLQITDNIDSLRGFITEDSRGNMLVNINSFNYNGQTIEGRVVNGTQVQWDAIDLQPLASAPNNTVTATFSVEVAPSDHWPSGRTPRMENTFGNETVTTDLLALEINKRLAPGQANPIAPGEEVRYQITVENTGAITVNLDDVEVKDTLPNGFNFVIGSATNNVNVDTTAAPEILFDLPNQNLAPGNSFTFQYATQNNNFSGQHCNTALVELNGQQTDQIDLPVCVTVVPSEIQLTGFVWLDENNDQLIDQAAPAEVAVERTSDSGVRVAYSCGSGVNTFTGQVNVNGNGQYFINNDARLVEGTTCELTVTFPTDRYGISGTNTDGRPGSAEGLRVDSTDTHTIDPVDADSENTFWNFGLERLAGDLQVQLRLVSPDGSIVDIDSPADIGGVQGTVRIVSKPSDSNASESSENIPPNVDYGVVVTGDYEIDFTPPPGFADVTVENEANPYEGTVTNGGTEVINVYISGSESIRIDKFVWDENADDGNGGTGAWVEEIDAVPGEVVQYLVIVWNSGTAAGRVTVEDRISHLGAVNRGQNPVLLFDNMVVPADVAAGRPDESSIPPSCSSPGSRDNFIFINYCVTLEDDFGEGDITISNTANITDGGTGNARAFVNVSYEADLNVEKRWEAVSGEGDGTSTDPFRPQDQLRYIIDLDNTNGTAPFTIPQIIDDLSDGTGNDVAAYGDVSNISHNGVESGDRVVWENITVPAGETVELTFLVTIRNGDAWPDNSDYTLSNSVTVNEFVATSDPAFVFWLEIDKSTDRNTRVIGPNEANNNFVNWNIEVTNHSAVNTNALGEGDVLVIDNSPNGFDYLAADSSLGGWDDSEINDTQIEFTLNNIAPNDSETFVVRFENAEHLSGRNFRNAVEVLLDGNRDLVYGNDRASVTVEAPEVQLTGYVWIDENSGTPTNNGDALINLNEAGRQGVTVQLIDTSSGDTVTTGTNNNGQYVFNGVELGNDYHIVITAPNGFNVGFNNQTGEVGTGTTGIAVNDGTNLIWELGVLTLGGSQYTYNFSLQAQTNTLTVNVWDVTNDGAGTTRFPVSLSDFTVTSTGGFSQSFSGVNPAVETVPLGTYTATLAESIFNSGDWVDVTGSTNGCNASDIVNVATPGEINLCVRGDAEVNIDKAVREDNTAGAAWSDTLGRFEPGDTVPYAVRIWNQGAQDVVIDVQDVLTNNQGDALGSMQNIQVNGVAAAALPNNLTLEGDLTCSIPDRDAPGADACSVVITYDRVLSTTGPASIEPITITNTASFDNGNGERGQATANIEVHYTDDIREQKILTLLDGTVIDANSPADPDDFVQPGEQLTYTLRVRNVGNAEFDDFSLSDDIEDVLRYTERSSFSSTDGGELNGDIVSWPEFDIPAQSGWISRSFQITVAASDTWPTNDGFSLDNTFGNDVSVPAKDIHVAKSRLTDRMVTPSTADGNFDGGVTTWEIEVTNLSDSDITAADGLVIEDTLPGNVQISVGSSQPAALVTLANNTPPRWNLAAGATIVRGQSITFTFETTNGNQRPGAILENCAFATQGGDVYRDLINGCDVIEVAQQPGATVSKTVAPTEIDIDRDDAANNLVTYTVTVVNTGNTDFTNLVINDVLPLGDSGRPFSYAGNGNINIAAQALNVGANPTVFSTNSLQWALANIAGGVVLRSGQTLVLTYDVQVPQSIDLGIDFTGTYRNDVDVLNQGINLGSAQADLVVNHEFVDLAISKTDNLNEIRAGEQTTYTIVVENNGNADATNVVVTDELPVNASFSSSADMNVFDSLGADAGTATLVDNSNATGELVWIIGTLPAGGQASVNVTVMVDVDVVIGSNVRNRACAEVTGDASTLACNNDINTVVDSQITITKDVSSSRNAGWTDRLTNVQPGQTVFYRVQVTNTGTAPETFDVDDIIPVDGNFSQVIDPFGNTFTPADADASGDLNFLLTNGLITLQPNSTETMVFSAVVEDAFTINGNIEIPNRAGVDFNGDNVYEADDQAFIEVTAIAEPIFSKSAVNVTQGLADAEGAPAAEGNRIEYTLSVTNDGSAPTTSNFIFRDDLSDVLDDVMTPATFGSNIFLDTGAAPVCATSFELQGDEVVCDTGDVVDPDETVSFSFAVIVGPLSQAGGDNDLVNEWEGDTVTIGKEGVELEVSKVADTARVREGNRVTFTLTVTNTGNTEAEKIVITDRIEEARDAAGNAIAGVPAFTFQQMTGTGILSTPNGNGASLSTSTQLQWTFDNTGNPISLNPGESVSLSYVTRTALLPQDAGGNSIEQTYDNGVLATSDGVTSNTATVDVTVVPRPDADLDVSKEANPNRGDSGQRFDFTIRIENDSNVNSAAGFTVSDQLPIDTVRGLSFEPIFVGGNPEPGYITILDSNKAIWDGFDGDAHEPTASQDPSTGQWTLEWTNVTNGFTIPPLGVMTIRFSALAPDIPVGQTDWDTTNIALVQAADIDEQAQENVTVIAPPAPDLALEKGVLLGTASANQFQTNWPDVLNITDLSQDTFTYRLVLTNNGAATQEDYTWIDTTDFTATGLYDELRVYRLNGINLAEQSFSPVTSGSFIALENNADIAPGQSITYFIEATLKDSITNANLSHTNISQAQDQTANVLTDQAGAAVRDTATVNLDITPANIVITKDVATVRDLNRAQQTQLNIDPSVTNQLFYFINVQNTGGVWTDQVDILDTFDSTVPTTLIDAGSTNSSIYDTIVIDFPDGRANQTVPGDSTTITLENDIQLQPGFDRTYVLIATLNDRFSVQNPIYENVAVVRDNLAILQQDNAAVQVDATPSIVLDKQVRNVSDGERAFSDSTSAEPGDILEYRINVENQGFVDVANVVVTDVLDDIGLNSLALHEDLTRVVISNFNADGNGRSFTGSPFLANVSLVQARDTESYTFRVQLENPFPQVDGFVINNAANPSIGTGDTTQVTVNITPDIQVKKLVQVAGDTGFTDVRRTGVQPSDTVNYRIVVWNAGDGATGQVNLTDVFSPQASNTYFRSADNPTVITDFDGNGNAFVQAAVPDHRGNSPYLSYTINNVMGGGTENVNQEILDFTLQLRTANNANIVDGLIIDNDATVQDVTTGDSDTDGAEIQLNVPSPDFRIRKEVSQNVNGPWFDNLSNVSVGTNNQIFYRISVWNVGDGAGTATINDVFGNAGADLNHYTAASQTSLQNAICGGAVLNCDADGNATSFNQSGATGIGTTTIVVPANTTFNTAEQLTFSLQLRTNENNQNALAEGSTTRNTASIQGTTQTDTTNITVRYPNPRPQLIKEVKAVGAADSTYAATLNAQEGDQVTYRITMWNTGDGNSTFDVTDVLTNVLHYASIDGVRLDEDGDGNSFIIQDGVLDFSGNSEVFQSPTVVAGSTQTSNQQSFEIDFTLISAPGNGLVDNGSTANTASITFDGRTTSGTATVNVNFLEPNLNFSKSAINVTESTAQGRTIDATSIQAEPNDVIRYTLTVTNTGDGDATAQVIEDNINDLLRYGTITNLGTTQGVTGVQTVCNSDVFATCVQWSNQSITANGGTATYTFDLTLGAASTWPDVVNINRDFFIDNTFGNNVRVPVGEITENKSVARTDGNAFENDPGTGLGMVRVNDTVRYTLTITNSGAPINNYRFVDDVRDLLEYVNISNISSPGSLNSTTQEIVWTLPTLNSGITTVTFDATVKAAGSWPIGGDFRITNVFGDTVELTVFHTDVEVEKFRIDGPGGAQVVNGTIAEGDEVHFRITIENTGEVPVFQIKIRDIYDTDLLDFDGATRDGVNLLNMNPNIQQDTGNGALPRLRSGATGNIDPAGLFCWQSATAPTNNGCAAPTDESELISISDIFTGLSTADDPQAVGADVTPALLPGETISFETQFTATGVGRAENEAYVWVSDNLPYTIVGGGDDDDVTIGATDLTPTKTANQTSISTGGSDADRTVTYTVTVTNNGSVAATNQVITDTLPTGADYQGGTLVVSRGGVTLDLATDYTVTEGINGTNPTVQWTIGTIAVNDLITFNYDVILIDEVRAHTNAVQVNTKSAEWTVNITSQPNATITKTANISSVEDTDSETERTITYTLTVTNTGQEALTSLQVIDQLPAGLTYQVDTAQLDGVLISTANTDYDTTNNRLTWIGGVALPNTLAVGESFDITYQAIVQGVAGAYPNTAAFTSAEAPRAEDSYTLTVNGTPPPLQIDKQAIDVRAAGDAGIATYQVTLTNTTAGSLTDVTLVDTLPVGAFDYRLGTAQLDGSPTINPVESINSTTNQEVLTWSGLTIPANGAIIILYEVDVPAVQGYHTNVAQASTPAILPVTDTATIFVDITTNPVDPGPTPTIHVLTSAGPNTAMLGIMIGVLLLLYFAFTLRHRFPQTWAVRPKTNK